MIALKALLLFRPGEACDLFGSIFWKSLEDGTIVGAIPTCFLGDFNLTRRYNIAIIEEHMSNRLINS